MGIGGKFTEGGPGPVVKEGQVLEWSRPACADDEIERVLVATEEELDAMIRAEGRDPAQVAEATRRVLEVAVARAKGGNQ